ncbi:MAG: BON domain-containing protein [Gallionellaceae bacterium]|jgi:osmotically-inducible protein OsmY
MMRYLNILLLAAALVTVQGCAGSRLGSHSVDRRSAGTQLEDDQIENKSVTRIGEKYKDASQVTVTSFNRFVLITGSALSEDIKNDVERIVRAVPNVKNTANEITVGALATSGSRRTDSGITGNVKSNLNKNKTIRTGTFRVATDKGVVYLLGLVTHAEANTAAEIASTTTNVKKVVRVFEYID